MTLMSPQCVLSQCLPDKEVAQERQVGSAMHRVEKGSPASPPHIQPSISRAANCFAAHNGFQECAFWRRMGVKEFGKEVARTASQLKPTRHILKCRASCGHGKSRSGAPSCL